MMKSRSKFLARIAASAVALVSFYGCGGGGGGGGGDGGSAISKAYYVDSPISGVGYECGDRSGTTDANGTFYFERGEGCTLSIGTMVVRTLEASELRDGIYIFESDNAVAALLQSLDGNGDPSDGIAVARGVAEAVRSLGIREIPRTERELQAFIDALLEKNSSLPVAAHSYAEARGHMIESYAGYKERSDVTLSLTDGEGFAQDAAGPVLYNIPVMGKALSKDQYRLTPLSDAEFNSLDEDEKFRVANKLLGTLFYGMDAGELNASVGSGTFLSDLYALFQRENSDEELAAVEERVHGYFQEGTSDLWQLSTLLARMYLLPPGKAYLNRWSAYVLAQTILFSPAYELGTVYTVDAIDVYSRLARDMDSGFSMQWITFKHMVSDENWRRFRSPEDNGREMLEIFLMDFNDAHVPLAAKALKNWKLDRRSNTLVITLDENVEPIEGLFRGRTVTTGTDFYSTLVLQPDFLPTVSRRLVEIYFPNYTPERRESLVDALVASNPSTWRDLLLQIVFSREYLLFSEKTRSFEESFYQIAKALHWVPKRRSFYYLADALDRMHQATMRYKLGRKTEVPLDSQSFAYYYKAIRENVLTNYCRDTSPESRDDGWPYWELFAELPPELIGDDELDADGRKTDTWYVNERKRAAYIIDRLFVAVAGRKASEEEKNFLTDLIDNEKYDAQSFDSFRWYDLYGNGNEEDDIKERSYFALLVLDYLSYLSELFEFRAVK
jgi:hypothetical protein